MHLYNPLQLLPQTPRRSALRIALIYAVLGATWIIISDGLLTVFDNSYPNYTNLFALTKGILFVLITTLLLYYLITQANQHIHRSNRLYAVLTELNHLIIREHDPAELQQQACFTLVEHGGFSLAWIGYPDPGTNLIRAQAIYGQASQYVRELQIHLDDPISMSGPAGTALITGKTVVIENIATDERMHLWREQALAYNLHSVAAFPLQISGAATGILVVYANRPVHFIDEELRLIITCANDLAFAIEAAAQQEALRLSEERNAALLRQLPAIIWTTNTSLQLITHFGESRLPTQVQPESYEHQSLYTIFNTHDTNFPPIAAHLRALEGESSQYNYQMQGRDFLVKVEPRRDLHGTIIGCLAIALDVHEQRRLQEHTVNQLRRLQAIHAIDQMVTNGSNLSDMIDILLEQVTHSLQLDASVLLLFDPHSQVPFLSIARGLISDQRFMFETTNDPALMAAQRGQPIIYHDRHLENGQFPSVIAEAGFRGYAALPLFSNGAIRGVLEVFDRDALPNNTEWFDFLMMLADHAAVAIDTIWLREGLEQSNHDLREAYNMTIDGWSRALDLRDKETEGHSQRVTAMTVRMARLLKLPADELIHIWRGALLHDIGKLGVPDSVLLKPGPLTDEEWQIMRRHPQLAYDMLAPIAFLRPALDIPFCHHERWDGKGYPRGLKGPNIPLSARIFALADAWDAMRSDRPYRRALSIETANAEIRKGAGSHFDPDLVESFLNCVATYEQELLDLEPPLLQQVAAKGHPG
jgi:HD-GYP domain-containing protein (c-di-GMP phosphodiesterase class II)/PAS domain-containing protein